MPNFPALSGTVEPPEALRNPHYSMRAEVDADASVQRDDRLRDGSKPVTKTGTLRGFDERPPASGAFTVELRVWDRDCDVDGRARRAQAQQRHPRSARTSTAPRA